MVLQGLGGLGKSAIPLGLTSLGLTGSISHPSDARVEPNPHELGNGGNLWKSFPVHYPFN